MAVNDITGYDPEKFDDFYNLIATKHYALGINYSDTSPDGQIATVMSESMARLASALQGVYAQTQLKSATGQQLDNIGTMLGVNRIASNSSIIILTNVTTEEIIVPSGTTFVYQDGDTTIQTLEVQSETVIASNSTAAIIVVVISGTEEIPANTNLTVEVEGIEASTTDAVPEYNTLETDAQYRARILASRSPRALNSADSLTNALSVHGSVNVVENSAASDDGIGTPAYGAQISILNSLTDAQVADIIRAHLPVGTPTAGSTTVSIITASNNELDIKFNRATTFSLATRVTIDKNPNYTEGSIGIVRSNVERYTNTLDVGDAVDGREVLSYVYDNTNKEFRVVGLDVWELGSTVIEITPTQQSLSATSTITFTSIGESGEASSKYPTEEITFDGSVNYSNALKSALDAYTGFTDNFTVEVASDGVVTITENMPSAILYGVSITVDATAEENTTISVNSGGAPAPNSTTIDALLSVAYDKLAVYSGVLVV